MLLLSVVLSCAIYGQEYSQADTLRGSITPERAWWDLGYYHLDIEVNPYDSTIMGSNEVQYTVLEGGDIMQIDLQEPLQITRVTQDGQELEFTQNGPAHHIHLTKEQRVGEVNSIIVHYGGNPHIAQRAPWDGGITWTTDNNGNPFAASSCQGIGASIWWPCKDHMYDEVDSMLVTVKVPEGLMDVGNGQLRSKTVADGKVTTEWYVDNPINNYGVNINVGDYVHFDEVYQGEAGALNLDYYVLRDNLDKAKEQFKQVPMMMDAFEHWFGPYAFYADGFKLVEAPYLGMEHQSSVTYGNKYVNGYLGQDLSGSGWGLKFDFIIIHEAGHEWFANNITYRDIADMWVHEGFTAYSESIYVEYHYGKEAGADYVIGTRSRIANDKPIIGTYGVNARGSGDMYYKGSNLLHTIRQIVGDDELWRTTLRGLNKEFYHKTVTTQQIEQYMINQLGIDLTDVFDQYLRDHHIPILEYRIGRNGLAYRWSNVMPGFDMPVDVMINETEERLNASTFWRTLSFDQEIHTVTVDRDYYVASMKVF
jgi:aminopeptidase N